MTNMACARVCVAPTALRSSQRTLTIETRQDVEVFEQPSTLKPLIEVFILPTH